MPSGYRKQYNIMRLKNNLADSTLDSFDGQQFHPKFSSRISLILSCLGCVVGTGNIWRFPRIVANNSEEGGSLVFLIVWVLFLFLWSIPMLTIEYATGRFTQKAVVSSFRELVGDKLVWCGAWIVAVAFMIASYYSVILGWCAYYTVYFMVHSLPETPDESKNIFDDFTENSYWPILTTGSAIVIACLCVVKGVKTIEKVSMVLVPVLLLLILFNFFWSLTREYADKGITFMFTPNWNSFTNPRLWVDALSQNAFDTGAGAGLLLTYSSFMTRNHGVVRYSTYIPMANNLVSLVSGITIFSAAFSCLILQFPQYTQAEISEILKSSGPGNTGLTFIWLPVLFQTVGTLGRALIILFFLSLSFAGLTSLISNVELFIHTMADFGIRRVFAVFGCMILMFGVSMMSALNMDVLTNQDFVWGFALIINGLLLILMVVLMGTARYRKEVINDYGIGDWKLAITWEWLIKYIAPIEGLALIVWWAIDTISSNEDDGVEWYGFGRETFMITIIQWLGVILVLAFVNAVFIFCCTEWRETPEERVAFLSEQKDKSVSVRSRSNSVVREPGRHMEVTL